MIRRSRRAWATALLLAASLARPVLAGPTYISGNALVADGFDAHTAGRALADGAGVHFVDTDTAAGYAVPTLNSFCQSTGNNCGIGISMTDTGTFDNWILMAPLGGGSILYGIPDSGTHHIFVTNGTGDSAMQFPAKAFGRFEMATVTGMQTVRPSTGSCGAAGCDVAITWPEAFADTNYTTVCSVLDATAGNQTGLYVERVSAATGAGETVKVANLGAGAITGTLQCYAIHD